MSGIANLLNRGSSSQTGRSKPPENQAEKESTQAPIDGTSGESIEKDSTTSTETLTQTNSDTKRPTESVSAPDVTVQPSTATSKSVESAESSEPSGDAPAETQPDDSENEVYVVDTEATIENIRKSLGARATSDIKKAVQLAQTYVETDLSKTLLDDTIMSMRMSGLSHRKIAAELGGNVSEEEIANRLSAMYSKMEQVTVSEYRMLQVARLEEVINMCWALAREGSFDHIEALTKAIERLNKMFELEQETARIEVEVVTNAQAVMLMSIVSGILNVITSDPRITRAVPIEELQAIAAKALDVAEAEIVDEDGNVVTVNPKKK